MMDGLQCHFCSLKTTDTALMVSHVKEVHFQGGEDDYLSPLTLNHKESSIFPSGRKKGLKVNPIESMQGKGYGKVKLGAKKLKPVPASELAKLKLKPVSFEEFQRLIQKDEMAHKNPSINHIHNREESTEEIRPKRAHNFVEEIHEDLRLGQHESKVRKIDKRYQCKECPYTADHEKNLQRHVTQAHEKPRHYQCQQCPYKATRFSDLQQHTHQKDTNDTSFISDLVRLNSIERLGGAASKTNYNKRLRLQPVPADELAKLKLKPVTENDMKSCFQKSKQELIEPKRISTREKHIKQLLAKQASHRDSSWNESQTKSHKDVSEQQVMNRHIKNEAGHSESAENTPHLENENDPTDDSCQKGYEESQKSDMSGAIETVLEEEPLTFMKKELEDLAYEQTSAKMKLRCNACGFKTAEMVEMTGHLISEHVDEL